MMLPIEPEVSSMNMMFGDTELWTGNGVSVRSVGAANELACKQPSASSNRPCVVVRNVFIINPVLKVEAVLNFW